MNKELTKEEAEEFYNKLWLENKELIQENIDKINTEIFELELELVDKDKEIERLNNALKEYDRGTYCKLINENRKLNNIIKEVREYIKENNYHCKNQVEQEQYDKELLEILDKENI